MQNDLKELIKLLQDKKLTIAFAESVTSGLLVNEIAKQFNIGEILVGSIVSYKEECKKSVLGVKAETLKKFTAESQEVTTEMVYGLHKLLHSDIGVAVTGLATEGGSETKEKPVGTIFISILFKGKVHESRDCFFGDREMIIFQACYMVIKKVKELLS